METIGTLGRRFGVARSTLLHYDRIGLLCPRERSKAGYRLYETADAARLARILELRRAGLPLEEIKALLDSRQGIVQRALAQRLGEIDADIQRLRAQQRFILEVLRHPEAAEILGVTDKAGWTALLTAAGFSERDMLQWHAEFERSAPKRHQAFLEYLRIPEPEIAAIRSGSARRAAAPSAATGAATGAVLGAGADEASGEAPDAGTPTD